MKIKEVIVVEGKSDTQKIRGVVEADTIETNGSAINQETLAKIKRAQEVRGVIVFTDPDFAGEKIRKTIMAAVPQAKHAFITQEEGKPKGIGSLGIEHASKESILHALSHIVSPVEDVQQSEFDRSVLQKYGLIAGEKSRQRRERLGALLNIGYTNGKQLQKRLTIFKISETEFRRAIAQVLEEEGSKNE